jgi:hypothetical protein
MSGRIDIDVNEQRDPAIMLYGLSATDGARTFYYDETNNHRLVYLTDKGLNVPDPKPFVLGGVVHLGVERPIDLAELRRSIGIQPNARELKYDMVAKGDFTAMLSSRKVGIFLDWIAHEGYLLHFIALDPVYFSYVDIIDSMPEIDMFDLGGRFILKNDLYRVLRRDLGATQAMLRRHSYPALADSNVRGFLRELISMVEDGDDLMPHFNLMMLKGVLQSGRSLSSLPLLDNTPGLIMRDFASMFTHRLCLFKDSRHILDREDKVGRVLEGYRFVDAGRPVDLYRFADSKSEPGVQLADVVVGLLGACLAWLRGMSAEDVLAALARFTPAQDGNRLRLAGLVDRSIDETDAFVQKAISLDDMRGLELFLER